MALLLEQKNVWGITIGTKYKLAVPDADAAFSQLEKYGDWVDLHGIGRSTALLGMESRLQNKHSVIPDARELWAKLSDMFRANCGPRPSTAVHSKDHILESIIPLI